MNTRKQKVEAKLSELCKMLSDPRVFGLYVDGTDEAPEIVLHLEGKLPPKPGEFPSSITIHWEDERVIVPVRALPAGQNRLQPALAVREFIGPTYEQAPRPCPGGLPIAALGQATLGVNIDWPPSGGAFCLLSNNHAISGNQTGVKTYQPTDLNPSNLLTETTGFVPVCTCASASEPDPIFNQQDLAWAEISRAMGSPYIQESIQRSVRPNGIGEPKEADAVWLVGAASSKQNAVIKSIKYCVRVQWPRPGMEQWAWFKNQILLDKIVTTAGDSGAVYMTRDENVIVGIHVGANDLGSWGSRLLVGEDVEGPGRRR